MYKWQQYRQIIIAFTFVSVLLTLGKYILDPTIGKRSVTSFAFPSVVPLPEWQLIESRTLKSTVSRTNSYEGVLVSQKYLYTQNNHQLEIEMSYVVGTLGRLHDYLRDYAAIQLQYDQLIGNARRHEKVGFYSLFVYQGRSHLAACINPRGGSTVNKSQFLRNRYTYDLQPQRLVFWLLGKESLLDRRCLWAHLSMPTNQVSAEATLPVLETVWQSWYQWWSSRFPAH